MKTKASADSMAVNHVNSVNSVTGWLAEFLRFLRKEPFAEFELLFVDFQGLDPVLKR